jgi:S1/P1 Nuclease
MKSRIPAIFVVFLILAGGASQARAWNDRGHMTVAYLAYKQLTPATKARVKVLLQINPFYDRWAAAVPAGVSAADKDMIIFMLAATWADEIKGEPGYITDGPNNGNTPPGTADDNKNTGYDDKLRHKYRHFIDIPFSTPDGLTLPAVPTPNAQDSIALFRGVIASADPDPKKSYDLSWLLHLVGDIHQPLHATTRVTSALPQGDSGGNSVKLSCTGCPNELHAFWDDAVGVTTKLAAPPPEKGLPNPASIRTMIKAAKSFPAADATAAAVSSEAIWVQESFDAAKQTVYPGLVANSDGSSSLTPAYKTAAKSLAKKRIALAGARLANLLNNELH